MAGQSGSRQPMNVNGPDQTDVLLGKKPSQQLWWIIKNETRGAVIGLVLGFTFGFAALAALYHAELRLKEAQLKLKD